MRVMAFIFVFSRLRSLQTARDDIFAALIAFAWGLVLSLSL